MSTEVSPILNLLLAKGVGRKKLSEIVDDLLAHGLLPEHDRIDTLARELQWKSAFKAEAFSVQEQADELAEQLHSENICLLVRGIDPYPKKLASALGKDAPPILFVKGNLSILEHKSIGYCGSRYASDKGIHVAAESARQFGEMGIDVVSGYAKGVDIAAHCAALDAGGTTTIVLAEGILHFRTKREIESLLSERNSLVVSEFSPRLPWNARNAMQRNDTIIGLSDAMIVIESGTTGGTHACADSALRRGHPLFVAEFAAPPESALGNRQLLDRGALPLKGNRNGRPNLNRICEVIGRTCTSNKEGESPWS